MTVRLVVLIVVLAAFGVLSTLALMDVGYFGILEPHFRSWGGAQVFADAAAAILKDPSTPKNVAYEIAGDNAYDLDELAAESLQRFTCYSFSE